MKIHPPKLVIDEAKPFNDALFGRKVFAESMTTLLRNVSESLVVFVHAPWGEGKTTFAQMWRAHLRNLKLDAIYYDAYSADYFDDAFVSFSGEILALVDKRFAKVAGVREPRREFKTTAVKVGKRLAGLAAKVGLRAATLGAVEAAHINELKDIGSELASGVSEIGADVIEDRIENYVSRKELTEFRESLAKLAAMVRKEQGFPLTIIVDELDRCRPDFALALLERIKHLFDVEGVAFVLLVNRDQIESYIQTVYGAKVDARAYLLKFGNLFVDLPIQSPENRHEPDRAHYCKQLMGHYGLAECVGDSNFLMKCLQLFVEQFSLTLREIEKVFAILVLYYGSSRNDRHEPLLITMLAALKVKRPQLYAQLSRGTVSPNEFFNETGLDQFKRQVDDLSEDWIKMALRYLLMTDSDIDMAKTNDPGNTSCLWEVQRHFGAGRFRKLLIPSLCNGLDRFSLNP